MSKFRILRRWLWLIALGLTWTAAPAADESSTPAAAAGVAPYAIGKSYTLTSSIMGEPRVLNVMLPAEYDEHPELRYPVIFLLDGGQQEDFTHIAGAVAYASLPWVKRLPPSILVGIANTDRKRDMTHKASPDFVWPKWMHGYTDAYRSAGGSERFMAYLEREVLPFVDQQFRTTPARMLVGQSLAGLLATELLLRKPQLFSQYVIMSPSLWWDNGSLLKQAPQTLRNWPAMSTPVTLYLAVGAEGPEMVSATKALLTRLQRVPKRQLQVRYEYWPKEDHGTLLHPAVLSAFAHFARQAGLPSDAK